MALRELAMTPLRQRYINDLRLRNLSPRTIECYVAHMAAFARHFGRSPEQLDQELIREYQLHLRDEKQASWSVFNQAVFALRFFYKVTLPSPWAVEHVDSARMILHIRSGKGQKDRFVPLSPKLLEDLRRWWQWRRPTTRLFPGRDQQPLNAGSVRRACRTAAIAAGMIPAMMVAR